MRKTFVIVLAMAMLASMAFAAPFSSDTANPSKNIAPQGTNNELDEIIWSDDFEGDNTDWEGYDPAVQPVYWQEHDWDAAGGANSWHCYTDAIGDDMSGGYDNDWLQLFMSPIADWSAVGDIELTFDFKLNCEDGNWDGANVWVFYGNDPDNLTGEWVTPTAPAYTETGLWAFELYFGDANIPGWAGEAGEPFNTAWTGASFDLSAYSGYSYAQIAIAFSSDGAYNSADSPGMFGMMVDNVVLEADGNTVFADDADGNNIGGAPEFLTGIGAAGGDPLPIQWGWETDNGAPAGPTVMGIPEYNPFYDHYFEGPAFNAPDLAPGEGLRMDCNFNSIYEDDGSWALGDRFYWRLEVWNPIVNVWQAGANVGGQGNNYVYPQPSNGWSLFSDLYGDDWILDAVGGEDGVRVRAFFHSPDEIRDFTLFRIDNIIVERTALSHDVSTMLHMPYPVSVGTPVYGKAYFTNNGPNTETGFIGVWQLGGPVYPLYPADQITIEPGEVVERSIDIPTDDVDGYWLPLAGDMGEDLIVDAYHTLGNDEIPENDAFPTTIAVMDEGIFEFGTDSRNYYGSLSVFGANEGPTVHIDPETINPDVVPAGSAYDISELRFYGFWWNGDGSTGGAATDAAMEFHVYEGGATPGAEIWSGTYDYIAHGTTPGDAQIGVMAAMDVSDVAELQGLTGSIYVEARLTTTDQNGVYYQPLPYRTGMNDFQDTQFSTFADAQAGSNLSEYGHHVTIVVDNIGDAAGPLDLVGNNTQIPAGGGVMTYTINFNSPSGQTIPNVAYWTMVETPAGNMVGPLMVQTFTHTPFMSVSVPASLNVPGGAPNGTYEFYGHMGFYPNPVLSDSFPFTKGADTDDIGQGGEWNHGKVNFNVAGDADLVAVPEEFELGKAYPNPFNPTTSISVALPTAAELTVAVYNVMGQQVAELASGKYTAGTHNLVFDASAMSSGVYFIQAQIPGELNQVQKVTLLK